jgi:diguanylate cyclase (GGDEF)-like protein
MSSLLYRNEHIRAKEWAASVASVASHDIAEHDQDTLREIAAQLIRDKSLAYVVFADASGNVLAWSEAYYGAARDSLGSLKEKLILTRINQPQIVAETGLAKNWIDVTVPVSAESELNRPAGYVRLAVDVSATQAKSQHIAAAYARTMLMVVLGAICGSLLLARVIIRPINELARTSRAIANGDMDARATVRSRDEIGELAEAFNTMAQQVATTQRDMAKLNAELEHRVEERTEELQELASRDPLTGLYNRRHFGEVMNREFAAAGRYDQDLTCLMFDLDLFKEVNDNFGHRAGDEVLCALADAIRATQRESDVAARFGGDEFILLLPQTTDQDTSALTERIEREFLRLVQERLPNVPAGVSVGVASLKTTCAASAEALIHEADLALYAAKTVGRDSGVMAGQTASVS